MANTTVTKTLRLKQSLLAKAKARANDKGYHNVSEYIRTLIIIDLNG